MAINYGLDNRVDAYRGNPNRLEQKYAQNRELIDLLALQKIKSEKQAAARDLQLKMAQKQAEQGQPPTTKDKLEQEVMNMTKQEIAQQMGGIAQQRQQEQQRKMQQLMQSGVATLPAPSMARMAGGGIVAFAGEDGSYVEGEDDLKEPRYEDLPIARDATVVGNELTSALASLGTQRRIDPVTGDAVTAGEYLRRQEARQLARARARMQAEAPARNRTLLNQADAELRSAPAPAPASGVPAALPGAKPSVPAPAAPPSPTSVAGVGLPSTFTDPMRMKAEEEARISKLLGISPEEKALYQQGVKDLEKLYAREMDPKAQRDRELTEFLLGAAGRTSLGSIMAGGAARAEAERRRNVAEQIKGLESIQKKRLEPMGIARAALEKGIGAGQSAATLGKEMRGQDIQSRDKELDRIVDREKLSVQAEANAALRDQNNFYRLNTALAAVNRTIADITQKYTKEYAKTLRDKEFQLQTAKGEDAKKLRNEIEKINAELDAVVASRVLDLQKQRESLETAISGGVDISKFTSRQIK